MKTIKIGSGAGFGGDRIEPALDLIEHGDLDYICFECLAERTISIAVQQKNSNPQKGYNELLENRFEKILPAIDGKRIKVITNMGAANPIAAAEKVMELAIKKGLSGFKIAAVVGDDVMDILDEFAEATIVETGGRLKYLTNVLSANAYCGVSGILEALQGGANIIITGRVADPSLFLAPLIHEFDWKMDDYELLGRGTCMGHLLECAAQVMGGYYADPGYKDVPDLWNIGFPMAEVSSDGAFVLSKLPQAGGMVTVDTVIEQLLYEIQDPVHYFTPDVVADFSEVGLEQIAKDEVRVTNAKGYPKTGMLKANVGYLEGYIGEGEISYGGSGAVGCARLAGDIIQKRIEYRGLDVAEIQMDYIGLNSLYKDKLSEKISKGARPYEVRLRVAARCLDIATAREIGNEVEALYLNGPAGGGGARKYVRQIVSVASVLIPEDRVNIDVQYWEV